MAQTCNFDPGPSWVSMQFCSMIAHSIYDGLMMNLEPMASCVGLVYQPLTGNEDRLSASLERLSLERADAQSTSASTSQSPLDLLK